MPTIFVIVTVARVGFEIIHNAGFFFMGVEHCWHAAKYCHKQCKPVVVKCVAKCPRVRLVIVRKA